MAGSLSPGIPETLCGQTAIQENGDTQDHLLLQFATHCSPLIHRTPAVQLGEPDFGQFESIVLPPPPLAMLPVCLLLGPRMLALLSLGTLQLR